MRVGAAPVELQHREEPFVVGRTQEADLTVPSQRVSRRHAEIFWRGAKPWIKDCGSQNGTMINGRRLAEEHALSDGDEISIGPYLCTYRKMQRTGSVGKASSAADTNALTQPMTSDAMAGNLEQMNLYELLQTLEFNKKSGTLEVFGSDGQGTLIVKEGAPVYADTNGTRGAEAVFELLGFTAGQFSFGPEIKSSEQNLQATITGLLLEAGRRLDEGTAQG